MRVAVLSIAGLLWTLVFAFAFVAAPFSCEWGLRAYFYVGVALPVASATLPIIVPGGNERLLSRPWVAVILCTLGAVVWLAGFFLADFRIICRLF